MHHPTDMITHTTAFVTPVVDHWLEREIAQWYCKESQNISRKGREGRKKRRIQHIHFGNMGSNILGPFKEREGKIAAATSWAVFSD